MLKVKNLNSFYGETQILRDLNLEIPYGKVIALMGKNGVGKTTLLKTIMGLISECNGEIVSGNQNITKWSTENRAKLGIGYVPQGREIFPYLTVKENLLLGLETKQKKEYEIPEDIFKLFPGLESILSRKGGDLSGGQQQQLALARVLISQPKILLLDEPTEGIQPSIVIEIENTIRFIKQQGTISILLVEQYLDFALRLSDYFYLMEKGTIVDQVSTTDKAIIKNHLMV